MAAAGGDASAVQVTVTPVVPLANSDPTGSGLAAASFPLMIGGMLGGVLAAPAGFAVAVGLVLTFILHSWFEYLPGDFAVNALARGVSILETSSFIVDCASLLGRGGIALGL